MTCHFISKVFDILLFQSQAVIVIVFLPVFQLDDKIDVLFLLDTLNTIECLDIDDSDSAQFDKISRDVR